MTTAGPSAQSADLHLATALRATASCCDQISRTVLSIEQDLFLDGSPSARPLTDLGKLQSLDFLRQSAEDLAAMLVRLSEAVPQTITVERHEIVGPMKLKELQDRIGGLQDSQTHRTPPFAQQEIELF